MITVVPRLSGQSSPTPVAPRTCTKQPGTLVHMLDVWLQSRLVRWRWDRSTLDLEIGFLSSLTILWGSLTWTAFAEDLLMCLYTRYVCKLLQLFHHLRLDVWRRHPFAWMFCRAWYFYQVFKGPHLSLDFEWTGSILSTADTLAEWSGTVR